MNKRLQDSYIRLKIILVLGASHQEKKWPDLKRQILLTEDISFKETTINTNIIKGISFIINIRVDT